jgi:hypothetical protein
MASRRTARRFLPSGNQLSVSANKNNHRWPSAALGRNQKRRTVSGWRRRTTVSRKGAKTQNHGRHLPLVLCVFAPLRETSPTARRTVIKQRQTVGKIFARREEL